MTEGIAPRSPLHGGRIPHRRTSSRLRAVQRPPFRTQLERSFFLNDQHRELVRPRRRPHNRLGFALQLGTVRFLGTFLVDPLDVPAEVVAYQAGQLGIRDVSCLRSSSRTESPAATSAGPPSSRRTRPPIAAVVGENGQSRQKVEVLLHEVFEGHFLALSNRHLSPAPLDGRLTNAQLAHVLAAIVCDVKDHPCVPEVDAKALNVQLYFHWALMLSEVSSGYRILKR